MALKDFRLENLPRSTQIVLFAILAVALVAAFYMSFMKGLMEERNALLKDVEKLERAVAQGRGVASQLDRFKKELAQLEQKLNALRAILPSQKETPQILRSIQKMAASSSLKITKFVPQAVVPRAFYADWPIRLEVDGSYDALGYFFEKVSQAARIINVDNIAIRGLREGTNESHTLTAVCTATTFVFREDQALDAVNKESKR